MGQQIEIRNCNCCTLYLNDKIPTILIKECTYIEIVLNKDLLIGKDAPQIFSQKSFVITLIAVTIWNEDVRKEIVSIETPIDDFDRFETEYDVSSGVWITLKHTIQTVGKWSKDMNREAISNETLAMDSDYQVDSEAAYDSLICNEDAIIEADATNNGKLTVICENGHVMHLCYQYEACCKCKRIDFFPNYYYCQSCNLHFCEYCTIANLLAMRAVKKKGFKSEKDLFCGKYDLNIIQRV